MKGTGEALITVLTAIIGVAILAVLVAKNSQTSQVIQAFGTSFSKILGVATGSSTGA